MLIYKQTINNNPSPEQNTLTQNKIEQKTEQIQLPTISNEKTINFTSIPSSLSVSNKYEKEIDKKDIDNNNKNSNTIISAKIEDLNSQKIIPNLIKPKITNNQYFTKVILINGPSINDIIYLLENYLTENNYKITYDTSYEANKITFTFREEKIAYEFMKLIYTEKNKGNAYKNINVFMGISPNKRYIRDLENKRRGISEESILKLYKGNSYVKKIKPLPQIYGNINFGMKSPFYNVHERRRINKIKKGKSFSNKNLFNKNNSVNFNGDINCYIGYDGKPLKDYEKLKINVLNTHYKPISSYEFREDNKNKWISPMDFKMY